ncbi:hypothetical protein A2U01_0104479, partial [Trifolium medium]|nr:hypothetical protein [Trifolium medium]
TCPWLNESLEMVPPDWTKILADFSVTAHS